MLFLVSMLAYHYARPELEFGLLRFWNIDIRNHWDPEALPIYLYALWGCCGMTLIHIALNFRRNRRMEDHHFFHSVMLLVITLISLAVYFTHGG